MDLVDRKKVITMIRRSLNLVDPRLVDHNVKVAFVLHNMLLADGCDDPEKMHKLRVLALFHDIGAYRSEQIDQLLQFETQNVWSHSIYSYLFLRDFFPEHLARIVLYHHARYDLLLNEDPEILWYSQMLHVADRACVWHDELKQSKEALADHLEPMRGSVFSPQCIDLLWEADRRFHIWEGLDSEDILETLPLQEEIPPSESEAYLFILVNSIDFRSRTTVIHTRSVMEISLELATLMGMPAETKKKIYYGALMHDLGKIGTPLSILEKPGRLTPEEMDTMRQHVILCKHIIQDCVDDEIAQIALRHHEKLDGSGYPLGLSAKDLTIPQRLVAVADILSALCMARSYKDAYPKERSLSIIRDMADSGQLDRDIVALVEHHFDSIIENASQRVVPIQEKYDRMQHEFTAIMEHCMKMSNTTIQK